MKQVIREKKKRKMIPRAEWLKLPTEQKDVIIAQSKQRTKPKCEFCDKIGHTESECRALKNAIAELKKENAKKMSHTLHLHQSKRKRKKRDHMRRYTYIRPKPYYIINTTLCARTLYFAITVHQHRSSETRTFSLT